MTLTDHGLEQRDEHQRAVARLEDAMNRQAHLDEVYNQSLGTPRELGAFMRLRDARKEVSAFEKWLHWVDDEDNSTAPPVAEAPLDEVLGH